jgi:hypothetical protein
VYSTAGLQRVRLGAFERYGEVLSGAFIALVGVAFWIWPIAWAGASGTDASSAGELRHLSSLGFRTK